MELTAKARKRKKDKHAASTSIFNHFAFLRFRGSILQIALPLITAGVTLLIYLQTLAPTIFVWDSAELTTGAYTLGIVHAPGYPVYLLVAHLFTYLPFGDVAYRVNLLSAVASSATIYLLLHLLRAFTQSQLARITAALALGFSFYVWSLSIFAEIYTFHIMSWVDPIPSSQCRYW